MKRVIINKNLHERGNKMSEEKYLVFAFNGESNCFVHALLNAEEFYQEGFDTKLVIEGSATKQIKMMDDPDNQFSNLYKRVKDKGLIDCVCRVCAKKMESLDSARKQNLPICDSLSGHVSMARYLKEGYQIITF